MATGGDDGLVRLWDLSGDEQLSLLRGHTAAISGVSFSPDGSLLVSTGYDMTLRLWDAHTGALQHVLTNDWHNPPFPAFDPTDHLVATSDDYEENIQIWDTQSGKLTQHLTPPYPLPNQSNGVETLAFSPDGKILATSGQDHTVYLWDPHTGALIRALRDPTDDVTQIEFSPDGQEIAAAGSEHVARIWNVSTGQQLFVLSGDTDELDSLDFSHDGRLIAASSYDGSLRFWDADTGQLLKTVTSHPEFALLLFSHDSKTLAKMSRTDGTIRTFDPPPTPENAVTVICKAIGRNLTDAEWGRYATDQQRPDACPADK